ncbi:type II secretion system major pseudopilin GspG [Burkholderia pyrrocinia]|uniref:type II secretion system major pseudopilin GspG n=1 Tax=Burkholderia pyrrocinia TaxID=60550 RepID=UPI001FB34EF8|nr:type II secretion system major pseudopilin GspG [Burkholderia pyrrocinia]UOB57817.1 type II secretion system major pseudopilin GspG [Burkholderia pyrrocinia]
MKFLRTSAGSEAAAEQTRSCTITRARGFTLLELLVVIVIIGLLASYVGPKYFAQVNRSETTLAKAQLASFEKALDSFRLDTGRYPTTEEGLNALMVQPATLANWNGPYLKREVPPDPWGRPYQYRAPGPKGEFEIKTLGKNGTPGGTGESAEISIP